jgi:hypothetical protein
MIILVAVGIFFAIIQLTIYLRHNKKASEKHSEDGGEKPWLYVP